MHSRVGVVSQSRTQNQAARRKPELLGRRISAAGFNLLTVTEYRRRSKSAISAAVPKMVRHEGGVGTLRGDEEKGEGKGM